MRLAVKAEAKKDWAEAALRFEAAGKAAPLDRDRLAARLRLAEAQTQGGDRRGAVASLQAILGDEKLRAQPVKYDERWTVRADLLIADRLDEALRDGGRELYEEFDRKAAALLAEGRKDRSARLLEEVGRAFPAAKVAPEALLALGEIREADNQPNEAARAFKKLLSLATTDLMKARALVGLGRAYEAQGLLAPARDAYSQAQAKFPALRLDEATGATVGSLVAERLAGDGFARLAGDRDRPRLPVPLSRVWEAKWSGMARPIAAEGVPPSADAGRVFLVERGSIRPVDPATGRSAWTRELDEGPTWAGYLSGRLIVAGPSRVAALDPASGAVLWRFPDDAGKPGKPSANPFARPAGSAPMPAVDPSAGKIHDVKVVGGRVIFQRGDRENVDREVLALDGDTGGIAWTYAPPSGGINPHVLVGPEASGPPGPRSRDAGGFGHRHRPPPRGAAPPGRQGRAGRLVGPPPPGDRRGPRRRGAGPPDRRLAGRRREPGQGGNRPDLDVPADVVPASARPPSAVRGCIPAPGVV